MAAAPGAPDHACKGELAKDQTASLRRFSSTASR